MKHTIEFCLHSSAGLVILGSREIESPWEKHPALEASGATYSQALREIREECVARGGHIFGRFLAPEKYMF